MKLSEIKGEQAIEVFADLLEPASVILSDQEIVDVFKSDLPKIQIIQKMLKLHAKEIIKIMAILDGVPEEQYEVDFTTLPMKLIEIFNDKAISDLFSLQSPEEPLTSSGSAMESTQGGGV